MNHRTIRYALWGVLLIVATGVVAGVFWSSLSVWPRHGGWDQRALEGLENFGAVPDFALIERSGRQVKLSDLQGNVWVADFIYTACRDTCPLQSAEMAKLQSDLRGRNDVRLVSISVDPERDTPEVLSRYAERYHADRKHWLFLTGKKDEIYRLAQEGFRLSAVPASGETEKNQHVVLHSSRFVLVDGQTQIRGYYDSNDTEALQRLRRDLKSLLRNLQA